MSANVNNLVSGGMPVLRESGTFYFAPNTSNVTVYTAQQDCYIKLAPNDSNAAAYCSLTLATNEGSSLQLPLTYYQNSGCFQPTMNLSSNRILVATPSPGTTSNATAYFKFIVLFVETGENLTATSRTNDTYRITYSSYY